MELLQFTVRTITKGKVAGNEFKVCVQSIDSDGTYTYKHTCWWKLLAKVCHYETDDASGKTCPPAHKKKFGTSIDCSDANDCTTVGENPDTTNCIIKTTRTCEKVSTNGDCTTGACS